MGKIIKLFFKNNTGIYSLTKFNANKAFLYLENSYNNYLYESSVIHFSAFCFYYFVKLRK